MELKNYQKGVMRNLSSYMDCINNTADLFAAWKEYWHRQDIGVGFDGVPTYTNTIKGVPHICMKVPTGGGKTFMACAAVKHILDEMPKDKHKVVVWLVPSDPILNQTIKTFSDINHPYRQKLEADFAGRVGVYTKEQLLNGHSFSPDTVREMLTVCILSYGSLRIDSKKKVSARCIRKTEIFCILPSISTTKKYDWQVPGYSTYSSFAPSLTGDYC